MKIGVIGAGIAGLITAFELEKKGHEITVFERDEKIGGLAKSYALGEHFYDVGPHIVFSKDPEILEYMLSFDLNMWETFERVNNIYLQGKFINYPFENYLGELPIGIRDECLNEFLKNPNSQIKAKNMREFFLKTFGAGIYRHYLEPYNNKIWKSDLATLDLQMVSRIPNPPVEDIISGYNKNYVEGYTHQAKFYYPKSDGISLFVTAIRNNLKNTLILLNTNVSKVKKINNRFYISADSGSNYFDKVISTIPMQNLITIIPDSKFRSTIQIRQNSIRHLSLVFGLVVTNNPPPRNIFALTIPDQDIIFHRLSYINFLSKNKKDTHAYLYEITHHPELEFDESELKNKVIEGCIKINLFTDTKSAINFSLHRTSHAYVIYDLLHRETVDFIKGEIRNYGIYTVGRFGSHEYFNMDQVISDVRKMIRLEFF